LEHNQVLMGAFTNFQQQEKM